MNWKLIPILLALSAVAQAAVEERSLRQLGYNQAIKLQGVNASAVLKIPVSPREDIQAVRVVLDYSNSTALLPERSSLVFRLNGEVIGQEPITKAATSKTKTLVIPRSKLNIGYNDLVVQAIQHYTYECEDQASSELWTELNIDRSTIAAKVLGDKFNENPKLTQLDVIFDKRAWKPQHVTITTGNNYVSPVQMSAVALASQGVMLRKGVATSDVQWKPSDQMFGVSGQPSTLPGLNLNELKQDIVLIGRKSEISRFLNADVHRLINGPFLSTLPIKGGYQVATVISGETDEDVTQAAKLFADPNQVVADQAYDRVAFKSWHTPQVVVPRETITFNSLGYRTTTLQGLKPGSTAIEFMAPADYKAKKGDLSSVKLHFAYAGGIRADSTMVVKLNDQFVNSVPLNNTEGQEFSKFEVTIPSEYVMPGKNNLVFEPVFMASKEKCGMIRDEHMNLTVFEDSTLSLSKPSGKPAAPDLQRFAKAFWPHASTTAPVTLVVQNSSPDSIQTMSRLIGQMALQLGHPIDINVVTEAPKTGDFIIVGEYGALPEHIRKNIEGPSPKGPQLLVAQAVIADKTTTQVATVFTAEQGKDINTALETNMTNNWWQQLQGASTMFSLNERTTKFVNSSKAVEVKETTSWKDWFDFTSQWDYKTYLLGVVGIGLLFAIAIRRLTANAAKKRNTE